MFSNVQTLFRISSTKTGLFRISWLCSVLKGGHIRTMPAKFGLIWFSSFKEKIKMWSFIKICLFLLNQYKSGKRKIGLWISKKSNSSGKTLNEMIELNYGSLFINISFIDGGCQSIQNKSLTFTSFLTKLSAYSRIEYTLSRLVVEIPNLF
jgi:hypothetical protein